MNGSLFLMLETFVYFFVLCALLGNIYRLYELVLDWGVHHEIILDWKGLELIPLSEIDYSSSPIPIFPIVFFVNFYTLVVWRFLVESIDLDLSRGSFNWLIKFILFYVLGLILLFILTFVNNYPMGTCVLICNDLSLSLTLRLPPES